MDTCYTCYTCGKPLEGLYICDECLIEILIGIMLESINRYVGGEVNYEYIWIDMNDDGYSEKIDYSFLNGSIKTSTLNGVEINNGTSLLKLMRVGR